MNCPLRGGRRYLFCRFFPSDLRPLGGGVGGEYTPLFCKEVFANLFTSVLNEHQPKMGQNNDFINKKLLKTDFLRDTNLDQPTSKWAQNFKDPVIFNMFLEEIALSFDMGCGH